MGAQEEVCRRPGTREDGPEQVEGKDRTKRSKEEGERSGYRVGLLAWWSRDKSEAKRS